MAVRFITSAAALFLSTQIAAGGVDIIKPGAFGTGAEAVVTYDNRLTWGTTGKSTAEISKIDDDSYEVSFVNRLVISPTEFTASVDFDGHSFVIHIKQGPRDVPDTYWVYPPDGWLAINNGLILPEDHSGSIRIMRFAGM